jgi:CO/xanthine dehydrogenase Mo-binding subunit
MAIPLIGAGIGAAARMAAKKLAKKGAKKTDKELEAEETKKFDEALSKAKQKKSPSPLKDMRLEAQKVELEKGIGTMKQVAQSCQMNLKKAVQFPQLLNEPMAAPNVVKLKEGWCNMAFRESRRYRKLQNPR